MVLNCLSVIIRSLDSDIVIITLRFDAIILTEMTEIGHWFFFVA